LHISTLKSSLISLLLIAGSVHAGADDAKAKALATQNACLGCHAVNARLVGPAYKEVAAKYAGMAADQLAARIRAGSRGQWGTLEMPPQKQLSEADALTLASWVLAGSPEP